MKAFPNTYPTLWKKHKSAIRQAKELFSHAINILLSMILDLSSQATLEAEASKSCSIYTTYLRVPVSEAWILALPPISCGTSL